MNAEQNKQIKELEKAVTDAIKEKKNDLSFLENINDENHLRYIKKFIEIEISNRNTKISLPSFLVGGFGIAMSFIAIGITFVLTGISMNSVTKIVYPIGGIYIIFIGISVFKVIYPYMKSSEKMYLFNWNKIPGDDNKRLIKSLKQRYNIDWVDTAEIQKVDDGENIRVSTEKNSLSLRLNDEKTEVNLIIDNDKIYELLAKTEKDKLNIYKKADIEILNEIEFMHKLLLKIERKLLFKRDTV